MKLRVVYESKVFTSTTAIIIICNFLENLAEAEISSIGETPEQANIFLAFDFIFMAFFMIELFMNMYVHWFWEFWTSLWNIFDLIVVSVSFVEMILKAILDNQSVQLNILRTFRVFRVLGLLKKFTHMHKVMVAVLASVQPVFSALLILVMVISLYSLIGVQLFKEDYPEHFGSLTLAWCTILGLATGDCLFRVCNDRPAGDCFFCSVCVMVVDVGLKSQVIHGQSKWNISQHRGNYPGKLCQ
jgi:hypothetical protein